MRKHRLMQKKKGRILDRAQGRRLDLWTAVELNTECGSHKFVLPSEQHSSSSPHPQNQNIAV